MWRAGHRKASDKRASQILTVLLVPWGVAAVGLTGCALNRTAERDLAAAVEHYERSRGHDADAYAGTKAPAPPATQPTTDSPAGRPRDDSDQAPRSLRDYILLALVENPEIKAAEEMARAQAARVPQVTALPDPMLMTKTLPEPVRTAEGDNYFVLGVSMKFPVPEKLDRAGRMALQEARMALEALQQARLRVIGDVKRAYFRLYIVDRTVEVDLANQELVRGLIDTARAQVAAGRRTQGDVLRAQVELSDLESQLIELRQERETIAALLNRLLNRPPATAIPRPDDFDFRRVDARLDKLLELAVDKNPDLRRVRQQIERDHQSVELARLAYWPDFTLGFEWMQMDPRGAFQPPPNPETGMRPPAPQLSEDGSDNWAIVLGFNIPLWFGKIEGGIREARSRLLASQHQYLAARNRVSFQIADALARVRAQQELAELFRDTIIPQAQQAYEVSRTAYSTGTVDFLFVIDNWQKWLTFTVQYHRALGELERSVADLEEAIGLSLSEAGG
jgi:cobalt-zinc-cadmium efflux system outer membrane protein